MKSLPHILICLEYFGVILDSRLCNLCATTLLLQIKKSFLTIHSKCQCHKIQKGINLSHWLYFFMGQEYKTYLK